MYRKIALMKSKKTEKRSVYWCVLHSDHIRYIICKRNTFTHTHTQRAPSFSYPSQNLHSPNTDIPHYYAMFIKTVYSTHFVLLLSSPRRVPKWTYIWVPFAYWMNVYLCKKGPLLAADFGFFFSYSLSRSLCTGIWYAKWFYIPFRQSSWRIIVAHRLQIGINRFILTLYFHLICIRQSMQRTGLLK